MADTSAQGSLLLALCASALLGACATHPPADVTPNLTPIAGVPEPRAKIYADCIGQSAAAETYDRSSDASTDLIRFTCTGAPARAFFDVLEARSAAVGSQWTAEGRTWRSTNRVNRDLFGVDYCSAGGAGDVQCVISLNAGPFLRR